MMNQRFSQFFGLTAEELQQASSLRALIAAIAPHVSDPAQFAKRWQEAAGGVEPSLLQEVQVLHPAPRLLERLSRSVLDDAGLRIGRIEIYRDVTPHQLLQSKVHQSERLAVLGQRVSGIAHELSNPLTTILGYAQRLLRDTADSPHHQDIQRIFSEADRASAMLRQLLGSTRESPSQRRPIELNSAILRAADLQRFQLASEKIHLELELSPSLPSVLCDERQFQQILNNLISNARHALLSDKPGGVIFLRTRLADSGRVLLEVADSGPGIPEAHRHRIFEPFFTTKPSGVGTGLGLSIVMGLVRQNGGNIKVLSSAGQGATFILDFAAAGAIASVRAPDLSPAIVTAPSSMAGRRVLVVEDEPTVGQLIADMLSDLGYSPDFLQNARRGLAAALSRDYSLIICDMKMPGLDGQHFYRALLEAGGQTVKFLFVTGDVLGIATQEFLRQHRLPHIAKPFRLEEFAEKIALVLGRTAAHSQSPTLVGTGFSPTNLRRHG